MNDAKNWLGDFLQARSLEEPNGQMLFRYRASLAEYQQLKNLLSAQFECLGGAFWRFSSEAECAVFVFYASEWWRREYGGGAWRWHDIFQSLTAAPYQVAIAERSVAVECGLHFWGLRLSEDGHKYLGAIVANGGLPLQMVARGDGVLSRLLFSATRKAQLLGWETAQLVGYFESHATDMVKHLQATEIYRLLAEMVTTVMELRREYQLAGLANPVAVLDEKELRWRERFPVLVEDGSVERLLIGLVREVASQTKPITTYPVVVTRSLMLQRNSAENYRMQMEAQMPASISLDALAAAVGIPPSQVPLAFALQMAGEPPTLLGQGRQLLGAQNSVVLLTGKPRRFSGKEAYQELTLTLRGGGAGGSVQVYASVPGGEALDETQPWCFAMQNETLVLVGVGSCKVANDQAYVLAPENFVCSAREGSTLDWIGLVEDLVQHRLLYQIRGVVDVLVDDASYSIRTNVSNAEDEILVWKGSRFAQNIASLPIFKGVPKLYQLDAEGSQHALADKRIEWTQPMRKGAMVPFIQQHRGPVDAWLLLDGQRQRRFRMVLIAPTAEISYWSGASENEAAIELQDWGVAALHTNAALSPEISVTKAAVKLSMFSQQQPPAFISVTAQWLSGWPQLQLQLPFPAGSGRFSRSDGSVLPDKASISLQRIHDVRVQVFDQNPNAPKRYKLQMQLQVDSDHSQAGGWQGDYPLVEVNVPLLERQHIGELRFFEIASTLQNVFCQSSHLDARLRITLCAGSVAVRSLNLTRYDLELERQQQLLAVPGGQLIGMDSEQLAALQLYALPLLELEAKASPIEPMRSEGVLVGCWDMAQLASGHSPWLIYPAQSASLQVRPMLWHITPFDTLGTFQALGDALCPLGKAMSSPIEKSRGSELAKVVLAMSEDFEHPSWKLLTQHYQQTKHLPLSALDYWPVISAHTAACLVAILKLGGDVPELMARMRDELGVLWELTSERCLRTALRRWNASLQNEMGGKVPSHLLTDILKSVFTQIGQITDSLALQIERLLFRELGVRSDRFERMAADSNKTPQFLLQALWHGEDSLLQRILLRHHAQQEVWPDFNMVKKLITQIESQKSAAGVEFILRLGRQLVWSPDAPSGAAAIGPKQDVANTPLLLGILCQITDATAWLQSNGHLTALRQIKAFDPAWFDMGLQTGSLLALKAQESIPVARRS